jgi:hypothetical protein
MMSMRITENIEDEDRSKLARSPKKGTLGFLDPMFTQLSVAAGKHRLLCNGCRIRIRNSLTMRHVVSFFNCLMEFVEKTRSGRSFVYYRGHWMQVTSDSLLAAIDVYVRVGKGLQHSSASLHIIRSRSHYVCLVSDSSGVLMRPIATKG